MGSRGRAPGAVRYSAWLGDGLLLRLSNMIRVNSDVTVVGKLNNDPIRSFSQILQADDLRNVSMGSRRLWQRAEKRGNLIIVLDAAETHRR